MRDASALSLCLAFAEAGFDGTPLTPALARLAQAAGAEEVLLYRLSGRGGWSDVQCLRARDDVLAAYRRLALTHNPRRPVWARAPLGEPIDFDRHVPLEALASGPVAALMRQAGFPARHVSGIRLDLGDGDEARLSVGRNAGGPFDGRVLALLSELGQHLAAALRGRRALATPPGALPAPDAIAEIEVLPIPLAIADATPRLSHANAALRRIAARGEGLMLGRERLLAADAAADRALASAAEELARAAARGARRMRGIAVPRPGGRRPFLVHAIALGADAARRHGVLFIVTDPDVGAPDPRLLRRLLGFTAAEAELAAMLARGATLAGAAAARGISVETARTQLRSLLGKTGCSRQAELVRLLVRLGQGGGG
jgi:DNA-binding CsgD family transcriptional regulator